MITFKITKEQYDYMLPVFGRSYNKDYKLYSKETNKGNLEYFFMGTTPDYKDFLNRCKYLKH